MKQISEQFAYVLILIEVLSAKRQKQSIVLAALNFESLTNTQKLTSEIFHISFYLTKGFAKKFQKL